MKERRIVSWSEEEDDVLRQQISIHGADNWAVIASKFKDKTTRQCRRRWYTYLNSDFKKGGWSSEEDMLLCEAQKIFGNKWTEIAKVVSGRTDNAVKNRFTTLRKKRAKHEALVKEKAASFINQNNKRPINGMSKGAVPIKKTSLSRFRRSHVPDSAENYNYGHRSIRPPFAVLVQNLPKINFADRTQQAELLSSLAVKVNTQNTDRSFENAWKVVDDLLNRSKEGDIFRYITSSTESIDLQLEDPKGLVEDLRSSNEGSQQSWRQSESPCSSEYSTGSTLLPYTTGYRTEQTLAPTVAVHREIFGENNSVSECENWVFSGATINQGAEIFPFCDEQTNKNGVTSASSNEIGSPLQITPVFRSLAAGIPSPKFSESERHFLLKTFGVESPSPNPSTNPSQPPPCKRALLKSL